MTARRFELSSRDLKTRELQPQLAALGLQLIEPARCPAGASISIGNTGPSGAGTAKRTAAVGDTGGGTNCAAHFDATFLPPAACGLFTARGGLGLALAEGLGLGLSFCIKRSKTARNVTLNIPAPARGASEQRNLFTCREFLSWYIRCSSVRGRQPGRRRRQELARMEKKAKYGA
jgi:hypothetical protein